MSTSQRSKEDAMDYRYFPEPDILPIVLDDVYLEQCQKQVVELPIVKRLRYLQDYGLNDDDARILTADYDLALYFEGLLEKTGDAKKSCSFITSILLGFMAQDEEEKNIHSLHFTLDALARVIELVNADELSSTNAKIVIEELYMHGGDTDHIVDEKNLRQKNDTAFLESLVSEVLANNTKQVEEYRA